MPVSTHSKSLFLTGLQLAVGLVILKVTWNILSVYPGYLPPDFTVDFLRGRKTEFFAGYRWAFYPHIAAGPLTLILGMLLLSDRFRRRFPRWHARLGKLQVACLLLLLFPSGLWMAFYAQAGWGVKIGFALLALSTGLCAAFGWRTAVQRRFAQHRIWMWRCYVLLCSAVVTRLIGGFFVVTGIDQEWTYYLAAWASWLVPMIGFEAIRRRGLTAKRPSRFFSATTSSHPG